MLMTKGLKTQESLVSLLEEMKTAEKLSIDLDDVKDEDGVVRVSLFQPKECRIIMGYLKNKWTTLLHLNHFVTQDS